MGTMGLSFDGTTDFDCATCAATLDEIKRLLQDAQHGEPIDLHDLEGARDSMQELLVSAREWIGLKICAEQGVTKLMLEVQLYRVNNVIRLTLDTELTLGILLAQAAVASSVIRALAMGRG